MTLRRRWSTWNVRTLLVLVALVALGLGLWSAAAHAQRDAVAGLLAIAPGAHIDYDVNFMGCEINGPDSPFSVSLDEYELPWYVPRRVYRQLGRDYFRTVTVASFGGPAGATPDRRAAIIGHLARLRHLKFVTISSPVADDDVARLSHLTGLKELSFSLQCPGLTDRSLAIIGGFDRLESLGIGASPITDVGVAMLGRLARLKDLELGSSDPEADQPDSGVLMTGRVPDDPGRFSMLTSLSEFSASDAAFDGGGLRHLRESTRLYHVGLQGSRIADPALSILSRLPALADLDLDGTAVTAAGLEQLRGAPRLRSLSVAPPLRGDRARLAATLPGCDLHDSIDQR